MRCVLARYSHRKRCGHEHSAGRRCDGPLSSPLKSWSLGSYNKFEDCLRRRRRGRISRPHLMFVAWAGPLDRRFEMTQICPTVLGALSHVHAPFRPTSATVVPPNAAKCGPYSPKVGNVLSISAPSRSTLAGRRTKQFLKQRSIERVTRVSFASTRSICAEAGDVEAATKQTTLALRRTGLLTDSPK